MDREINIRAYNRQAWDKSVDEGNEWTIPVDTETIRAARRGDWKIVLTPVKPVPPEWFPPLDGSNVLCLASGGGQQGPILAAAGASITVFDNSPKQLAQDQRVARRDGLQIKTVEGDIRDLSTFENSFFDLIVHPVSNLFVPDIQPVWQECARVLKPGGVLLAGFINPAFYIFDRDLMDDQGILQVKYSLPYSDLRHAPREKLEHYLEQGWPLEFGHTLEDQIGGQIKAGFTINGFYEDRDPRSVLDDHMPVYIATRAVR